MGTTLAPYEKFSFSACGFTHDVYKRGEGVASDWVASLTLENIANGPVFVMPEMAEGFAQLTNPDRRALTEGNAAFILRNTEGTWD